MSNLHFVETPAAGRLALMPAPQRADFRALARAGVALVVSLLPADEAERLALAEEARLCRQAGFEFLNFPVRDFAVPESFGEAAALVGAVADQIAGGDAVAIHCRAGIGRSGMFASAVLVALGEAPDAAMAAVSAARGCDVPETEAQRAWVREFAAYAAERVAAGG
ncbi:protein-tyrosine phosphatase family protein [Prosthecodimorpha staleyi]|uniref:Dual specificity protein phosphatase family protein n=1 Tax=Prosthecodimorpha staleyi TaxID=2840188 RepID=A0A947GDR1_9HYPH|nr:tyrosine-protein phosphatase [Prosthecodimorpha staleyi]MBT9290571.1 dual specificity protein phosphatase family protein [Prosthecodimorpha staleyi]